MHGRAREDPFAALLSRIPLHLASPCISHPLWASGLTPSLPSRSLAHGRKPLCSTAFAMEFARDVKPSWRGPALADASAQPRSARMWERQHPPFDLPRGVPSRPGPARRSHGDDPPTSRQKRGRTANARGTQPSDRTSRALGRCRCALARAIALKPAGPIKSPAAIEMELPAWDPAHTRARVFSSRGRGGHSPTPLLN